MQAKICKTHGRIRNIHIYMYRGTAICRLCKHDAQKRWFENNKESILKRLIKRRREKIKDVKAGTLKKVCKRHGEIPAEKTYVNPKATLICMLCQNEKGLKYYRDLRKLRDKNANGRRRKKD